MKNKTLLNGVYAGALFFIWKIGVLALDKQHEWLPTFPAAPLLLFVAIFVFISITRYTDKNGTFADDFKAGARTALIAALSTGFFVYAYYAWFDPEFMPIRIQENVDAMQAAKDAGNTEITDEMIKQSGEQQQKFFAPFSYATLTVSGTAFFGMAFALIVSGLKRAFRVL